ncbi:MAG: S41 family peptidase [Gemmatimonadaceae bacterium]
MPLISLPSSPHSTPRAPWRRHTALAAGVAALSVLATPVCAQSDSAAAVEVLERYIAAIGGRALWSRSTTIESIQERPAAGGGVQTGYRMQETKPNGRWYSRTETGGTVTERGFDGTRRWERSASFRGYLPEDRARAVANLEVDLPHYREDGRRFVRLPDEMADGKLYQVVRTDVVNARGEAIGISFYFDTTTHLLQRRVLHLAGFPATVTYGDYRAVQGRTVPLAQSMRQMGDLQPLHFVHYRFDVPVSDSTFAYPGDAAPPRPLPPVARPGALPGAPPPTAALPESVRVRTLELVWRTIRDSYWDTTFNGRDWAAVRTRYLPLARQTIESIAFHSLLDSMVQEIGQTHFDVMPPAADRHAGTGYVGLELRWVRGELLVTSVDSSRRDSSTPTARAPRPGDVITAIDDKSPDALLAEYRASIPGGGALRESRLRVRAAYAALAGPAGSTVRVTMRGDVGRPPVATLTRSTGAMRSAADSGQALRAALRAVESRSLAPGVAYIRVRQFFADAVSGVRAALEQYHDVPALVLDLRGNPGGIGAMSRDIASLLSATAGTLGTSRGRYASEEYRFSGSGSRAYAGRLVILVDPGSASTSEVLAAGLQESGRATVIGDTTSAAALPSQQLPLPTGGTLQYPVADFRTPRGRRLEGLGVVPDHVVLPSRATLLAGRDAALDRALTLLAAKPATSRGRARPPLD